jgi:hypothetical protein
MIPEATTIVVDDDLAIKRRLVQTSLESNGRTGWLLKSLDRSIVWAANVGRLSTMTSTATSRPLIVFWPVLLHRSLVIPVLLFRPLENMQRVIFTSGAEIIVVVFLLPGRLGRTQIVVYAASSVGSC